MRRHLLASLLVVAACAAEARVFMTQQQALAAAFPAGTKVVRQSFFLTRQQQDAARAASGVTFDDQLIVRYTGMAGDKIAGYAYFDTHRVRTQAETVMVVLDAAGKVSKIEILSFDEPPDYFPRQRWIDQFRGRGLDSHLALTGAIRPISGASLTGRAIVSASRKILALHEAIGPK